MRAWVEQRMEAARGSGHTLALAAVRPGLVQLRLRDAASDQPRPAAGEPDWEAALELAVVAAFAGRDVGLLGYDPPLEWGDLDLAAIAGVQAPLEHGGERFMLAFLPSAAQGALAEVAGSQDFRHGALRIAPLAATQQAQRLVATLQQAGAHYPAWEEWLRLPPEAQARAYEAEQEGKLRGGQEFMECDRDGDMLSWFHPPADALGRCVQALGAAAETRGWVFKTEGL